MFNMGMGELMLVLLIAFVVVGPKDLPKVAKAIARFIRYVKELVAQFQEETGLDEVMKDLKATGEDVKATLKEADLRKEMTGVEKDLKADLNQVEKEVKETFGELKKIKEDI